MIKTKEEAFDYINEQEASNISFCKIGEDSNNLVVSFGSANHGGFDRKGSLINLKYDNNNFDILYLRDMNYFTTGRGRNRKERLVGRWYLGGLKGIGKNINHTLSFLKKQINNYDNVIFTGISMGGYASILFGSLLKINHVIAVNPQTDLEYIFKNVYKDKRHQLTQLKKRKKQCSKTWNKYCNLKSYLDDSVKYHLSFLDDKKYHGNKALDGYFGLIMHSSHHLKNIIAFDTVNVLKNVDTKCPHKQGKDVETIISSLLI